jgi:hypothetical protein
MIPLDRPALRCVRPQSIQTLCWLPDRRMVNHIRDLTPALPTWFLRFASVTAFAGILLCNGCRSGGSASEEKRADAARAFKSTHTAAPQRLSIQELDQLTYGYADRYFMVISSAVDAIKRGNPDPTERRMAHQIKLHGVMAMNDIVSGNDPYAQTLDLVVSVTLESILLIDENGAEVMFGDRAPVLIQAIRTMRLEAWELAAKVLTQEQLELLDFTILEWRRTHPEIEQVAYVKFDNFAGSRAVGLMAELKSGSGFLAPLSEASQVLNDWGRLTERVFWYTKRAPNVAAIQAEGAVNEILSAPEINDALQTAGRLGKTAESVPEIVKAEREAIFANLESHQSLLTNLLGNVRQIAVEVNSVGHSANSLATNIGQTLLVADTLVRHLGLDQPATGPPGRPFDILEFTAALTRLNEVVTNVHQLSLGVDQLTRSEGWQRLIKDMTDATDRRLDRFFVRLCLVLGLGFILAVLYRIISLQLKRRMAPQEKS